MLDLLDRDTRGRDPPHPPSSAPRCFSDVDLTVRLRTCVGALPASHLNLNLKLDEREALRGARTRVENQGGSQA